MPKLVVLTAIVAAYFMMNSYAFQILQADSNSMSPTIQESEFVGVNKLSTDPIFRGELIVFNAHGRKNIVKRVIGVAGDRVIYRNKVVYLKRNCTPEFAGCDLYSMINENQTSHGKFKQDGYPLTVYRSGIDNISFSIAKTDIVPEYPEKYFRQEALETGEWLVPKDHVFVLGDNRDHSLDSRQFGFVDLNAVIGRAVLL